VAPNIVGEVNEIGVKGGYRICPYVLVKEYCWAQEKFPQYQTASQEKAERSEQELEQSATSQRPNTKLLSLALICRASFREAPP
jgi:hypothetical protein